MLSADRIKLLRVQTKTLAHLSKTAWCPPFPSNKPRHHQVHFLWAEGMRQNASQKLGPCRHTNLSNNNVQQWFVFFTHHMSHFSPQACSSLTVISLINNNTNFCKNFIRSKTAPNYGTEWETVKKRHLRSSRKINEGMVKSSQDLHKVTVIQQHKKLKSVQPLYIEDMSWKVLELIKLQCFRLSKNCSQSRNTTEQMRLCHELQSPL